MQEQHQELLGSVRETAHLTVPSQISSNNHGNYAPPVNDHAGSWTPLGNDGSVTNPGLGTSRSSQGTEPNRQSGRANSNGQGTPADGRPKPAKKRNALRLGTLNIRGLTGANNKQKLNELAKLMKWNRWGILALQETHAASEKALALEAHNQSVYCFANDGPPNARGTMFMINRRLWPSEVAKDQIKHKIILQGRAHLIKIKWDDDRTLTIVNVYAPNDKTEFVGFMHVLTRRLKEEGDNPDIVLGDFNHVEFAIDRLPQRNASAQEKDIINYFKEELNMRDGFREAYPTTHSYTWCAAFTQRDGTVPRSRIDRIYCKPTVLARCQNWTHETSQALSDHDLALVDIANANEPDRGPGVWRLSKEQVDDPECFKEIVKVFKEAQVNMEKRNADVMNAWFKAKARIKKLCQDSAQNLKAKRTKHLAALGKKIKTLQNDPLLGGDKEKQARLLSHEIDRMDTAERATEVKTEAIRTRYAAKGETVSKYWLGMNKYKKMNTTLKSLIDTQGDEHSDTGSMARIANDHHKALQSKPPMTVERMDAMEDMGRLARPHKMDDRGKEKMTSPYNHLEIRQAIKKSHGGKAPGADGLTYELYKKMLEIEEAREGDDDPAPEITKILEKVFNRVATMKGAPEEYVKGIMFFLYKKGDRRLIKNYRPITLLNSDYKLQTKILASRLGETTQKVIHKDQAGFVPGRDILDHVKLADLVTEYCEVMEINGCIIALDQEKAYDRIDHEYLYYILRQYGLPDEFIEQVESLYKNAQTTTMVNGFCPKAFPVARGVRQGDPLSCLLFNLAIEPLAESLRQSSLEGIKLQGATERLICKLFADDTMVYLDRKDKLAELNTILDHWCLASTAKFNVEKTEFMPVGPQRYREKVVERRSLQRTEDPAEMIPNGVKIHAKGDAMRVLGGWIGYNIDQEAIWEPKLKKMEQTSKSWGRSILTLKGRKIIVNSLILPQAQYLMMTNRPPPSVVKKVEKIVHDFFWRGRRAGAVRRDVLQLDFEEGGLRLPSFEHRVETSVLMWAKKWRSPPPMQPLWAEMTDTLLQRTANKRPAIAKASGIENSVWDPVQQDWAVPRTGLGLSKRLMELLQTPVKYGIKVDAPKIGNKVKRAQTFWMNRTSNDELKNGKMLGYGLSDQDTIRRLKSFHRVNNMQDAFRMPKDRNEGCPRHYDCIEYVAKWRASLKPKWDLQISGPKDNLDHTPNRLATYSMANKLKDAILINPNVTHRESWRYATRIFAFGEPNQTPGIRDDNEPQGSLLEIFTDGSADKNGLEDSNCGAGGWSEEPDYCFSVKVGGHPPTNNRGEIAAILRALQLTPSNRPLLIRSDSMYAIRGITGGHREWEDLNWLGVKNDDIWRAVLARVRVRTAETWIQKVEAHSGVHGNEQADNLAKEALDKPLDDQLDLTADPKWFAIGARLSSMKFKDLYTWVRELNKKPMNTKVRDNLRMIREDTQLMAGGLHYTERIWKSLWKDPIRREVSCFLWQAIHGRTVVGPYFRHWGPEWEAKMWCECHELETLEHVLKGCYKRPWVQKMWDQAATALDTSEVLGFDSRMRRNTFTDYPPFPPPYGWVLGIGLYKTKDRMAQRLVKIIVSETAFAIWKCRCALRVREEDMSTKHAISSWNYHLSRRATEDYRRTWLPEYNTPELKERNERVRASWKGLLSISSEDSSPRRISWIFRDHG